MTYRSSVLIALAACTATTPTDDDRDASFLGSGKADTGGIEDGSPEAVQILAVANTATADQLIGVVGLSERAADAIVAYRLGDDEQPGTADDERFDNLAELDAVPYIGPIAFGEFLAYVRAHDRMVLVPAASFAMGCIGPAGAAWGSEFYQTCGAYETLHQVTVHDVWIDRTEVTNADYRGCVNAGGCSRPSPIWNIDYFSSDPDDAPVVRVTWDQANAYCAYRGKRLPTEAEWEHAARGEDGRMYPWGASTTPPTCARVNFYGLNAFCNFNNPYVRHRVVGPSETGPGNDVSPFGAIDMLGNVSEWVHDFYDLHYFEYSPEVDPQGPDTGISHVVRGGDYETEASDLRLTLRGDSRDIGGDAGIGFRCAED
jgi:formylglycine-generating enzyme required for sulfatase activity